MKILFIHQNFPGQFKHLAPALARQGHECVALTLRVDKPVKWQGVQILPYKVQGQPAQNIHPWLHDLDSQTKRGTACFLAARKLKEQGYNPDLILTHHGWGESMYLRDVWPEARMGLYCELYHQAGWPHVNFDPEFPSDTSIQTQRVRMKNINNHLHFDIAQAGISPTRFQADTFPKPFRDKITICHDGIDTRLIRPDPSVTLELNSKAAGRISLSRDDEVITFVNRNLEPYRGYHRFMRALPNLLRERPKARVLIVGGDETSYGTKPPEGQTWKQIFIDEVRGRIPTPHWNRVHFLGKVPYEHFIRLLKLSRVHVYLTYPFVVSWSLLEAMSAGAAIVAADIDPVREVLTHDQTARLVDFFNGDALVSEICALCEDAEERARLGTAARKHLVANYDLNAVCLPEQIAWVNHVMAQDLG
ncbi:glycosyltransferase [Roseibaca sp. Y0-43]|uniref:glycosyltransferase n=1 Tax=Roseibaca sp. Y0-43 TaxID=2816854 RepID=UPI001D0CD8AD|nr:glycosyltransferase [Roseibaca sp. Y0-43]MCC1482925.1 glycosyltransferase [Roseibaca sp. Y0-43]